MAADELPLRPLEPVSVDGSAPGIDDALEAELFAVAWFTTGGHDARASRAVQQTRTEFARSHHGAVDARRYALTLLVPRARRLARGVRPAPTGDRLLDDLATASPAARAAIALCAGLGLDAATAGQLLGVDAPGCESLCRHALGAARFVGVPEAVQACAAAQAARVRRDGLPSSRGGRGRWRRPWRR